MVVGFVCLIACFVVVEVVVVLFGWGFVCVFCGMCSDVFGNGFPCWREGNGWKSR